MTYETNARLLDSCVRPILHYGSELLGFKKWPKIDQMENRAVQAYLGVHRFSCTLAVMGDIGWVAGIILRKLGLLRFWNRLIAMDDNRLTKVIFNHVYHKDNRSKNWCFHVYNIFKEIGQEDLFTNKEPCDINTAKEQLFADFENTWKRNMNFKPKLRLYREIKQHLVAEKYVKLNLNFNQRTLLAQLRMGILPIRVDPGRFTNMKL